MSKQNKRISIKKYFSTDLKKKLILATIFIFANCNATAYTVGGSTTPKVYSNGAIYDSPLKACEQQLAETPSPNGEMDYDIQLLIRSSVNGKYVDGTISYNNPGMGGWQCSRTYKVNAGPHVLSGRQDLYWMYPVCPSSYLVGSYSLGSGKAYCDSCARGEVFVPEATGGGRCIRTDEVYVNRGDLCQNSKKPNLTGPPQGQPIFPTSGAKGVQVASYLTLQNQPLQIAYNSDRIATLERINGIQSQTARVGDMGTAWSNSFYRQLVIGRQGKSFQAIRAHGSVNAFSFDGVAWVGPQDGIDSLSKISSGYLYRDQAALILEEYDNGVAVPETGLLQSFTHVSGMKLTALNSTSTTPRSMAPVAGHVLSLTDPFGRSIGFTHASKLALDGHMEIVLNSVTDPQGLQIVAAYDANVNLVSLTWQDGKARKFVYNSPHANQTWALTSVIDEMEKQYATFGYGTAGWAQNTELAGGVYRFEASYDTAPKRIVRDKYDAANNIVWRYYEWQAPVNTKVTQPNNSVLGMKAMTLPGTDTGVTGGNLLRFGGYNQPAGAGCSASSSHIEYDTNGNMASQDDFNGHRTCYANNLTRNLEEVRVEGLTGQTGVNSSATPTDCSAVTGSSASLPTGSRKISTAWHPDWAIKTKQAEPLKLTTWVYNGQPDPFNGNQPLFCVTPNYGATFPDNRPKLPDGKDIVVLCKQVEQPTLDANGSQGLSAAVNTAQPSRTQRYTYTQYGQVLTSTDARNNTTSYEYYQDPTPVFTGTAPNEVGHYQGDLYKVTNAKGHVTTYTAYDRAGKPLSLTDPNGLVTTYAYWPRGWIKSVQVGNQTTSYTYWPTGLLKQVKNPDGSTLDYAYDDAHRLTDVTDNQGNTVHYTLDNAGNRKFEDVKDSSTALTRQIERAYDDLNRLKSVIGAAQ